MRNIFLSRSAAVVVVLLLAVGAAIGAAVPNSFLWQIDTATSPQTVTLKYASRTLTIQDPGQATGTILTTPASTSANGLIARAIAPSDCTNADGSALAASAAAGKFGLGITLATSARFDSESANNNTKTDNVLCSYTLPSNYVAGQNFTVTVYGLIAGSGTLTTKTAQVLAYREATAGTQGADTGPAAATAITAAGADIAFTITGTTYSPGDVVWLELRSILIETASSGMVASFGPLRVS